MYLTLFSNRSMLLRLFTLVFTLLPVVSSYRLQDGADLNIGELVIHTNLNGDGEITQPEVESFFVRTWGNLGTNRCKFIANMKGKFVTRSISASILYDILKNDHNKTILSKEDFTRGLLGGSDAVPVSGFEEVLRFLAAATERIEKSPHKQNLSPMEPSSDKMIKRFDLDENGLVSNKEIYDAMLKDFDKNDDEYIEMCEFIETMEEYQFSPYLAAQLHDAIFLPQDLLWSEEYSQSMLRMSDGNMDGKVTSEELKKFFEKGLHNNDDIQVDRYVAFVEKKNNGASRQEIPTRRHCFAVAAAATAGVSMFLTLL